MSKKKQEKDIVVGRTIVEGRELPRRESGGEKDSNASLDTERERVRKKNRRRVVVSVFLMVFLVGGVVALGGMFIRNLIEIMSTPEEIISEEKFEPTVEIVDENGGQSISGRTREYIGQLESDLKNLGYKMTRVSLPVGKMREIDVHLENVGAYFKVNVDRGTAVTAEDIVRMIKYLETNGISATYVDVRVEEKAFYK